MNLTLIIIIIVCLVFIVCVALWDMRYNQDRISEEDMNSILTLTKTSSRSPRSGLLNFIIDDNGPDEITITHINGDQEIFRGYEQLEGIDVEELQAPIIPTK